MKPVKRGKKLNLRDRDDLSTRDKSIAPKSVPCSEVPLYIIMAYNLSSIIQTSQAVTYVAAIFLPYASVEFGVRDNSVDTLTHTHTHTHTHRGQLQ